MKLNELVLLFCFRCAMRSGKIVNRNKVIRHKVGLELS